MANKFSTKILVLSGQEVTASNGSLFVNGSQIQGGGGSSINNAVTGFGTNNYIPKFTTNNSGLVNSLIYESGGLVGIGTTNMLKTIDVRGDILVSGGSYYIRGASPNSLASLSVNGVGDLLWNSQSNGGNVVYVYLYPASNNLSLGDPAGNKWAGYFNDIRSTGHVYVSGNINANSGNFTNRPTVNGVGVLLVGEGGGSGGQTIQNAVTGFGTNGYIPVFTINNSGIINSDILNSSLGRVEIRSGASNQGILLTKHIINSGRIGRTDQDGSFWAAGIDFDVGNAGPVFLSFNSVAGLINSAVWNLNNSQTLGWSSATSDGSPDTTIAKQGIGIIKIQNLGVTGFITGNSGNFNNLTIFNEKVLTGLVAGSNITIQNNNNGTFTVNSAGGTINNFTVTGGITGSGINNYVPKFNFNGGLNNSNITSIGNFAGINVANPQDELEISGSITCYQSGHFNAIKITGFNSTYLQTNIQNLSNSQDASSDLVATADIGDENSYYINLGINSSKYTGNYIGLTGDSYVYSQANDFYIGNTNTGRSIAFFIGAPINTPDNSILEIYNSGIIFGSPNVHFERTTNPEAAIDGNHANVYVDNLAQRSILSYANSRGVGKMIQNTFALENIHNFSPNTTTTMNVYGTTATSAGTLSHPVAFADLTGFGTSTAFNGAPGGGPVGMQSATTSFFLTSGITGMGNGFFFASQFQFTGINQRSGSWPLTTGIQSGFNFFGGLTNATSVTLSNSNVYPTAALLGFQFARITGVSGRVDQTFKFVSKDNGAAAPFYVQETNCPLNTMESYNIYIYGRSDFRNGVHWMIKPQYMGGIYSGDFTGNFGTHLPIVKAASQTLLKPCIGISMAYSGAPDMSRGFKLKGLYCETV